MTIDIIQILQKAITAHKEGKLQEAESGYRQAIELKPDHDESLNSLGVLLHSLGRLDEAETNYKKTIEINRNHINANNNLGVLLHGRGKLDEAERYYKKTIELKPDNQKANNNLGVLLHSLGRLDEGVTKYKKAIEIKPGYAEAHNNLAITLKDLFKFDEAEASYKKAIEFNLAYPEPYCNLGTLLTSQGRLDEAEQYYKKAIELRPAYGEAHYNYSLSKKFTKDDEHFVQMCKLFLDHNLTDEQRCYIAFSLGEVFKNFNQHDESFKYYSEGNAIRKKLLNYNIADEVIVFDQLKESYQDIKKNLLKVTDELNKPRIVFIVGMPRSGTTLVEQIISSHSSVIAGGELGYVHLLGDAIARGITKVDNNILLDFREKYLKKISKLSNDKFILIDKTPLNFKYISLICSAFPEAKIIHVKRDAAATCWGNYQRFFGSKSLNYSYDLDNIKTYYKLYQNLMKFWEKHFTDRIYNIDYDSLTMNQEGQTKKLIQYLDLKWEDQCLAPEDNKRSVFTSSNLQIRRKIYQGSSTEWQKFKPFLKGAFDDLNYSL